MNKKDYFIAMSFLICSSVVSIKAQDNVSNIFKSGVTDINTVANGYLKPLGNGFAAGLGSNWYNTAEVHSVLGFDLTVGMNAVITPQSDQTFDITGLTNLKPTVAGTTSAPTFAGKGSGVGLTLTQPTVVNGQTQNIQIVSFATPKGVTKYVPTPSLQFTIGIPVVNDISFRVIPKIKSSDVELSLWGVGIKHNFKRWIPGLKLLPFDAAVMAAYTQFDVKYNIASSSQVTPNKLVEGITPEYSGDGTEYNTQNMHVKAKAFTAGIVVSKKLLFFTPYVGFGVTKTDFDIAMAGVYPTLDNPVYVSGDPTLTSSYKMTIINKPNPIDITGSQTMMNATIGFRLKVFGLVAFNAQYVQQKYPVASVGLGVNFR